MKSERFTAVNSSPVEALKLNLTQIEQTLSLVDHVYPHSCLHILLLPPIIPHSNHLCHLLNTLVHLSNIIVPAMSLNVTQFFLLLQNHFGKLRKMFRSCSPSLPPSLFLFSLSHSLFLSLSSLFLESSQSEGEKRLTLSDFWSDIRYLPANNSLREQVSQTP